MQLKKLTLSAVFLAAALLLPLLTASNQQLGNMFCLMHIPVLLCGFICGWQWGAVVGFTAPLLRFMIFGMPVIFPIGISMAFELCAYGLISGLLYKKLPHKIPYTYLTLVVSMLAGRAIWGAVRFFIAGFGKGSFSFAAFISGGFVNALPGIAIQLLLIPLIVEAVARTKLCINN